VVAFIVKWFSEYETKDRLEGDYVFLPFTKSL
jgi:hypothetical protein